MVYIRQINVLVISFIFAQILSMQTIIQEAWNNRELLKQDTYKEAVKAVIEEVDKGRLRTAEPTENGWKVN